MPLVEVGLPALALVVAVRNPRVPELHTLLAKLSITYRWCAEHCPARKFSLRHTLAIPLVHRTL